MPVPCVFAWDLFEGKRGSFAALCLPLRLSNPSFPVFPFLRPFHLRFGAQGPSAQSGPSKVWNARMVDDMVAIYPVSYFS